MNTRHAVVESPLGELTVVAEDHALTGLYFGHHWYRPADNTTTIVATLPTRIVGAGVSTCAPSQ